MARNLQIVLPKIRPVVFYKTSHHQVKKEKSTNGAHLPTALLERLIQFKIEPIIKDEGEVTLVLATVIPHVCELSAKTVIFGKVFIQEHFICFRVIGI